MFRVRPLNLLPKPCFSVAQALEIGDILGRPRSSTDGDQVFCSTLKCISQALYSVLRRPMESAKSPRSSVPIW